jgi:hypothetical protein
MIKELKDLKPKVDVLEPGKLKSTRGGILYHAECYPQVERYTSPHRLSFVCNLCAVNE